MNTQDVTPRRTRRFSLAVRISVLLMIAAIVPLVFTVGISELFSRPTLTNQARAALETDASERVQLINTYFSERTLDAGTLTQVPTVQEFLLTPQARMTQDITLHALYALQAGIYRDKHYTSWTLFNAQGQPRLYYPLEIQPLKRGLTFVPQENLDKVLHGNIFISDIYYDVTIQKASVDIYAPVVLKNQVIGFMRATLQIDVIWDLVNSESGANGPGSYAVILDENGVRIADANSSRRFTAVAPIPAETQLNIKSQGMYGMSRDVPVQVDTQFAQDNKASQKAGTNQATPTGEQETFQITHRHITNMPWTYLVLSPTSTVTAVVNQQLITTSVIALLALLLAAGFGLIVGQSIATPIIRSVDNLRRNTESLHTLATKQQSAATEQQWVVESSQVGLQSVQYYTEATGVAAHQLADLSNELQGRWSHLDKQAIQSALTEIMTTARYIENAIQYQEASGQKLATALKVTTQVTEQLATGATSAADAAAQLEKVVQRLRRVVGREDV